MKKTIHIHFICTGNAYRSRLAEAYLRSLQIPNVTVSSSGLEADKHRSLNGPVCWYALRIVKKHNIIEYISHNSVQTELSHISESDIVIFLHSEVLNLHKKIFQVIPDKYQVWDIPDVGIDHKIPFEKKEKEIIKISEKTFENIKRDVDSLVKKISGL